MALSIVSDLWQRVQEYFSQPYSLQKFIEDHKPSSMADIEYLEKLWYYHTNKNSWLQYRQANSNKQANIADIHNLRKDLLEEVVEYLDCKFHTHKKFAVLFFEHKLKQGISIENFYS